MFCRIIFPFDDAAGALHSDLPDSFSLSETYAIARIPLRLLGDGASWLKSRIRKKTKTFHG